MGKSDKQDIVSDKQSKYTPSTAWKKGQSGNPNGRPKKGQTLTDLANEYLNGTEPGEKVTRKEQFVRSVAVMAKKGDMAAIRLIWNYIDGMPVQKTEIDGQIRTRDFEDLSDEELQELFNEKIRKLIKE